MSAFRLKTPRRPVDPIVRPTHPEGAPAAAPQARVRVAFGNPHPWEVLKAILFGGSKG